MSSNIQVNKRPSQMEKPSTIPHTRVDDESVIETLFSMGRKLGQGSFGIVREAMDLNSGRKWAVKAVNKEKVGRIGLCIRSQRQHSYCFPPLDCHGSSMSKTPRYMQVQEP